MKARKLPSLGAFLMTGTAAAVAMLGLASAPAAQQFAADLPVLRIVKAAPRTYIIQFSEAPLASYRGGVSGLAAAPMTAARPGARQKLNARAPESLAYVNYLASKQEAFLRSAESVLGRPLTPTFTYKHALNGMAVELSRDEAARVEQLPGVVSVQEAKLERLLTDSGPAWIGAPTLWDGTATGGLPGSKGEGVLVGIIDSGINFDSPSFAAVSGDGYRHVNPKGTGVFLGTCAAGGIDAGKCNDKLIGAYTLIPASQLPEDSPDVPGSSADAGGHGSHVASTTVGNRTSVTTAEGAPATVSGVAPRANLIAYKTCYELPPGATGGSCSDPWTAAAVDQAVQDGVDVINFSISGGLSPWSEATSRAFNNATEAGIFVAVAAGNTRGSEAAEPGSAHHLEPWTLGVGAASHDRLYSSVELDVPSFRAVAGVEGRAIAAPVTGALAVSSDPLACSAFSPAPAAGFVAVIQRGTCPFTQKINNAKAAGAAAAIIYDNTAGPPLRMDTTGTTIPSMAISKVDGEALVEYIRTHPSATATARNANPPTFTHNPAFADVMAGFSLRGPAGGVFSPMDLVKPDISAPGENILAASQTSAYEFMSGTSMASPHVAGSGVLLRAIHPDWTPMEVKSALMLTARSGTRVPDGTTPTDPFNTGSGRVDLTHAAETGLVMDETSARMRAANPDEGGALSELNLASLGNAACGNACSFQRTFRNTKTTAQSFNTSVLATNDGLLSGTVSPATFTVAAGATQTLTIDINIEAAGIASGEWSFGRVELTPESGPQLSMPIAVRKSIPANAPEIFLPTEALASSQAPGETSEKSLFFANKGRTVLNWTIAESPASVTLSNDGLDAPLAAADEVTLKVDSGIGEGALGLGSGKKMMFLNQFTPELVDLPFTLQRVDVAFLGQLANNARGAVIGELFDIYVYQDTDANPANGAELLGSVKNVAVTATDVFQRVPIPNGIEISGAGDVLIALVAREATGGNPATTDNGPLVHKSWIGGLNVTIGDPPDLARVGLERVEAVVANFQKNLVLRGYGTRGSGGACSALADVPWLSATPISGTVAPTEVNGRVDVTFDSTGLNAGTYSANLCLSSNDPVRPLIAVPVTMTVTGGSGGDIIFQDGFEESGEGTCKPLQLMEDPSFELTTTSFGSNPKWDSADSHEAGVTVFCDDDCSEAPGIQARTGDWFAWFGAWSSTGTPPYTAFISQSVTIPSGSARYLNFWKAIKRASTTDTFKIVVDGTVVETVDLTAADTAYVQHSVDLSTFADGASHEVKFDYAHVGSGGDVNFVMDDVTLDCVANPSTTGPSRSVLGPPDLMKRAR